MSQPSILDHTEYRIYLREFAKAKNISFRQLSLDSHIHNSYFSRVLAEKAEFSEPQMYALAKVMKLREWELEYFLLMGSKSRNPLSSFQNFIDAKLDALREKHQNLREKLVGLKSDDEILEAYYEEAVTAKIHIALTIPRYGQAPTLLLSEIGISEAKLLRELQKLESLGLIRKNGQGKGYKVIKPTLHLERRHPVSQINHRNWRVETLSHLHRGVKRNNDYHFSALFSCDADTLLKIHARLQETLVAIQGLVSACPQCEEVYHLGIDLY